MLPKKNINMDRQDKRHKNRSLAFFILSILSIHVKFFIFVAYSHSFLFTERLKKGIFSIRVIHDSDLGGQLVGQFEKLLAR
jgi:hypothetical protein